MAKRLKDIFEKRPSKKHEDFTKIKKIAYKKDDLWQLKQLMKAASNSRYSYGGGSGRKHYMDVPYERHQDQRVTFKMSYSRTMTSHKKYVNNYLVQADKDEVKVKPKTFGTEQEEYENNMVPLNFKCIISPENQNVNLEVLCKDFIKRVQILTGYKFYWRAAIHNDTDHRHAHICINGKDADNKKVHFQKEWVRKMFRDTLSYLTTQMVGERTAAEIEAARKHLPEAKRWTELDEKLLEMGAVIRTDRIDSSLQERLAFLSEIKLAKKMDTKYILEDGWSDTLMAFGRYNSYLDNYIRLNGNLDMYEGGPIKGTVTRVITFDRDESWNDAVIVSDGNRNTYIPVWQIRREELLHKNISLNKNASLARIKDSDIHIER